MKEKYEVIYAENGGEYEARLRITARALSQINKNTLIADGVLLEFDEDLLHITKLKGEE